MPTQPLSLLITCEHGGVEVPDMFQKCMVNADEKLQSHRGWDPGALDLARTIAERTSAPLEYETRSRLLVDLNRSLGNRNLFSEFSTSLAEEQRNWLLTNVYKPYRQRVKTRIENLSQLGPVWHLSIHSFTPVLHGKRRRSDIGILYDPQRELETIIAAHWKRALKRVFPQLAIHFNLPYRGTSDGFTTELRTQFSATQYAGIELEVNQKFPAGDAQEWQELQTVIANTVLLVQQSNLFDNGN